MTDWELATVYRERWQAAQQDWWAHLKAHEGPYGDTLACTRLNGRCYGDGEQIVEAQIQRFREYQAVLSE